MAKDALLQLQASVTKTASFQGTGLNIPTGTPLRGLSAMVLYSAATNASGSNTVSWTLDTSPDNSTWTTMATGETQVALSTTAQAGEFEIPLETAQPYVRLSVAFAGAGSTPTVTYEGWLTLKARHG